MKEKKKPGKLKLGKETLVDLNALSDVKGGETHYNCYCDSLGAQCESTEITDGLSCGPKET